MAQIELEVHNRAPLNGNRTATLHLKDSNDQPLGKLQIGRGGITFLSGGPGRPSPRKKSWEAVIEFLRS